MNRIDKLIEIKKMLKESINNEQACITRYGRILYVVSAKSKKPVILFIKALGGTKKNSCQDSEVWFGCSPLNQQNICSRDALTFAIKVIPITKSEDKSHEGNIAYDSWKQIKILKMTTELSRKGISPNLPIMYYYSKCGKINIGNYINKNIIDRIRSGWSDLYGRYSVFIYNELVDYDFYQWYEKSNIIDPKIFYSLLFQVYAGLSVVNNKLNIVHLDFHGGNLFIKKNKSKNFDKYFIYELNGTKYYVPNYGYQFIIWDYSRSLLLKENRKTDILDEFIDKAEWFIGSDITNYEDNIHRNLFGKKYKKYQKYLYSYDTLVISYTIRERISKNPELGKIIELLGKIEKNALQDLTIGLTGKTNTFEYLGNSRNIIKKYFDFYTKKPKNVKEKTIYKIY